MERAQTALDKSSDSQRKETDDIEKIAGLLLHTHDFLISTGEKKDTESADKILLSLNDLVQLKSTSANKLIADHIKDFSKGEASPALVTLRETLKETKSATETKNDETAKPIEVIPKTDLNKPDE